MNDIESIKCPICKGKDLQQLYVTNSIDVIRHISDAEESYASLRNSIESLWNRNEASFIKCNICTFEFAHPFAAANAEFYSMLYHTATVYPANKWEYDISKEAIQSFVFKNGVSPRLIEIGAGNGSFIKLINGNLIPPSEIYATEYSENGAKMIEEMGIHCFRKSFDEITENDLNGKVHIVCLFQVLEHMTTIFELFARINELTVPGARVYISVPNIFHRKFFDRAGYHYDLPPIHVGRYNYKSMSKLAESSGWRILQHAVQPTSYKERILKFIYARYAKWLIIFNVEKIRIKLIRIGFRYSLLSVLMIINVNVIFGLRKSNLGTAQWFELERFKS